MRTYLPAWIFYLNMYWYSGAKTAYMLLLCRDNGKGGQYLLIEPAVTCWEERWHSDYVGAAAVGVTLHTVFLPCAMAYVLLVWAPKVGLVDPRLRSLYGFLYHRFRPSIWYWELVESLRNLLFVLIFTFGSLLSPVLQAFVTVLAIIPLATAELAICPYQSSLYDRLQQFTTLTKAVLMMIGIMTSIDDSYPALLQAFIWLFAILAVVYVAFAILNDEWGNYKALALRRLRHGTGTSLSRALFNLRADNGLLLHWLKRADAAAIGRFRTMESDLLRNVVLSLEVGHGADDSQILETAEWYSSQAQLDPFLLNKFLQQNAQGARLRGLRASSNVNTASSACKRISLYEAQHGSTAEQALKREEVEPFVRERLLPAHMLFHTDVQGRLLYWVAEAASPTQRENLKAVLEAVEGAVTQHDAAQSGLAARSVRWFTSLTLTHAAKEREVASLKLWEASLRDGPSRTRGSRRRSSSRGARGSFSRGSFSSGDAVARMMDMEMKLGRQNGRSASSVFKAFGRGSTTSFGRGSFSSDGSHSKLSSDGSHSKVTGSAAATSALGRRPSRSSPLTGSNSPSDAPGERDFAKQIGVLRELCRQLPCEYALLVPTEASERAGISQLLVGAEATQRVKVTDDAFLLAPGTPAGDALTSGHPVNVANMLLSKTYRNVYFGARTPISLLAVPVVDQDAGGVAAVLVLNNKASLQRDRAGLPFSTEDENFSVLFARTLFANFLRPSLSREDGGTPNTVKRGRAVTDQLLKLQGKMGLAPSTDSAPPSESSFTLNSDASSSCAGDSGHGGMQFVGRLRRSSRADMYADPDEDAQA